MVLSLDTIARRVANDVKDTNLERLPQIKRLVGDAVSEATLLFKKGSVYGTTTVSLTNGEGTLPVGVSTVLRVYDSLGRKYESVSNEEYRTRETASSTFPTVQIFENVPVWKIKLLNYTTDAGTISVDYLIASRNPAIMPDYYEELIRKSAIAKYHSTNMTPENIPVYREAMNEYNRWKGILDTIQFENDGQVMQMRGLYELEVQDPSNSSYVRSRNDFIGGGIY